MVYAGGEHRAGERTHYWKSLIIFSSVINLKGNPKKGKRRGRRYEPAMQAMTATLANFFARGHCRGSSRSRLPNSINWQKLDKGLRTNVKGLHYIEILLFWGLAGLGGAAIAQLGVCERASVVWICGYLESFGEC